tara:strand:+ start:2170 stop:2976 length:807 start_codon:yes stop_codon:yes gene_type:complete
MGGRTYPTMFVDGVALEYRLVPGDPSKPTIVLLHEGLGCVALWKNFPDLLAAITGCAVFAYSRAGYGGSDAIALPRPLEYMTREAIEVLPKVLACASIKRYVLVGHSDGASIALVYAGNIKDLGCCSVVAMAPHVIAEQCGIDSIRTRESAFCHGELRCRLLKYHGNNVDCAFLGWCGAWLDPDFMDWTIVADLAGIEVPLLLIQGREDEYGTPQQLREIERAVLSTPQTMELRDCGHSPHFDCADETMAAIAEFYRQTAPAKEPERR